MEGVYKGLLKDFSPRITVIVPTFNEMPGVKECLDSIKNQDYANFEIIVADGYSTDGTDKFAKKYGRVVKNRGNGPGPARNAGAYKGTGDIVAFTDADTVVPKDWLKKIAYNFATDEELIGVGGVLVPKDPRILDTLMFKFNSDLFYRFTSKVGFQQLATPNCAYRRDLFLKEKGFDETMSMFEDTELSVRMSRLGKVIIDKNLMVYNSTRRLRQESYSKLFFRYLKVYWNYLRGKPVSERHFETIEH